MTSDAGASAGMVQRKRTVANLHVDAEGLRVTLSGVEVAAASYHAGMQVHLPAFGMYSFHVPYSEGRPLRFVYTPFLLT